MVPVPKDMVSTLVANRDEDYIRSLADTVLPFFRESVIFMKGKYDLKRCIKALEDYMRTTGIASDHTIQDPAALSFRLLPVIGVLREASAISLQSLRKARVAASDWHVCCVRQEGWRHTLAIVGMVSIVAIVGVVAMVALTAPAVQVEPAAPAVQVAGQTAPAVPATETGDIRPGPDTLFMAAATIMAFAVFGTALGK